MFYRKLAANDSWAYKKIFFTPGNRNTTENYIEIYFTYQICKIKFQNLLIQHWWGSRKQMLSYIDSGMADWCNMKKWHFGSVYCNSLYPSIQQIHFYLPERFTCIYANKGVQGYMCKTVQPYLWQQICVNNLIFIYTEIVK